MLSPEIAQKIPKLYAQEKCGEEAIVFVKFFDPLSNWTWYVTEFDGNDTFFGLVVGHEIELGYFSLRELESYGGPFGIGIERDLHFLPTLLKELRSKHKQSTFY